MEKLDLKKELKAFYNPSGKAVSEVTVPPMNFLMVDGKGDPNDNPEFQDAIQALYSTAYSIKFFFKKSQEIDYPVMALEGLWWSDDMSDFVVGNKTNWMWTLMIMQPDVVTKEIFDQNLIAVKKKKGFPALEKVRFERYDEGRSAQIIYVGPFSEEGPTIANIHKYIENAKGKPSGKHHEIYLSDFRRVSPDKLKTILRQPFQ